MTLGAKSAEVLHPLHTAANRNSNTLSEKAHRDASRLLKRHEIRRQEGPQNGLTRFIIKS